MAEWLQETRAFAQRDDIYPRHVSMLYPLQSGKHPPKEFKPTPWFPIPWNKDQLAAFDKLPTLGFIHRPVFVPMVDKDGHLLTRRDARTAALAAGWQQALQTLPEAQPQQNAAGGDVWRSIVGPAIDPDNYRQP